ncbi:MAG: carbohydrate porin, partial [Chthoniobacteraceae bacterium]|nr:carbohydrate porin [Chthoniobacteraceae bacterium]
MALAFVPLAAHGGDAPPGAPEEPKALSFPVSYSGEVLGNLSGGYKQGAIAEGLLNVGVQGDLGKLIGWQGGSFLVSILDPHGPSLTDKYVHDFNYVSNIDAYDSVRLYEAWLQQEWADGKWSIRAGQLLADTEFFVSDNATLFLNGAFGAPPVASQNLPAAVFPVAAPGVRVRWKASDALSIQAAVFDGDVGDQAADNKHGVDWRLGRNGGVLVITEAAYAWNKTEQTTGDDKKEQKSTEPTGLPGVFKLGAFFRDAGAETDLTGTPQRTDAGGYVIVDQQLWREPGTEDQGLSAFGRIGGAPDDRNAVPFYADGGFNYKGLIPGREKDVAGLAFSYTKVSKYACDDAGNPAEAHHETILEATYKVQVK